MGVWTLFGGRDEPLDLRISTAPTVSQPHSSHFTFTKVVKYNLGLEIDRVSESR
jgi:hypothetical protein